MAIYLGSNTLADPVAGTEGFDETAQDVGGRQEMGDGSVVYDYVATRRRFKIKWRGLTTTQRNACWTAYGTKTAQTFTPSVIYGSATFSVTPVQGSWHATNVKDSSGTLRWEVEMSVEETG